jgi:cytidylate kinase
MDKDLLEGFARYLEPQTAIVRDGSNRRFPCITISRQMGAGGIEIAELLAERLGVSSNCTWAVFDRNLAELVWANDNLPGPVEHFCHEEVPPAIRDVVQELLGVRTTGLHLVEHTAVTILRLASLGNAIFIGRGANIITAPQKSVLHVRLTAPFAKRVRQVEEHHRLGTEEAVELITATDDARRRFIKHYFRAEIDDPINYHFVINTGLIGYDEASRIIADATMNLIPGPKPQPGNSCGSFGFRKRGVGVRTAPNFECEHLLANGAQGLLLLAQNFSGFFVGHLALAESLDHVPDLGAMLVGQIVQSVRRR